MSIGLRIILCALALLFLLALLSGCTQFACKTDAPDVHIAPQCWVKCKIDTSKLTADPNTIIDAAKDAVEKCDERRALCENALSRAQQVGAIK